MAGLVRITCAVAIVLAFFPGMVWVQAPANGTPRLFWGAPEVAAAGMSDETAGWATEASDYLAQVENSLSRFRGQVARLERAEGMPNPNYTAALKDFGEKEQVLRKAIADMKASGPNAFYQHKPLADAALAAFEGAYQKVEQAVQ